MATPSDRTSCTVTRKAWPVWLNRADDEVLNAYLCRQGCWIRS